MVISSSKLITNTWVSTTWNEYIKHLEDRSFEKAKGYYHNGQYRIEMSPISNEHSQDHSIINHTEVGKWLMQQFQQ